MVNNMTDLTAQEAAWQTRDHLDDPVIGELRNRFGPDAFTVQATRTGVPVVWIKREQLLEVGDFLKKLPKPYVMLFDLHGMDERLRTHREGLPAADFSVFYHLISIDRNRDIMLKVALPMCRSSLIATMMFSVIGIWNSYFWPLVMTNSDKFRPLTLYVEKLKQDAEQGLQWNLIMAGNLILVVPILIIYCFGSKQIIKAFTYNGIK